MNEKSFEQLLLDRLDRIDNRFDKIDNRLDRMDDRMTAIEDKIDERISTLENKMDAKTSAIENRIGTLAEQTAQIRGKLDARAAFMTDVKSWIAIAVAIAAVLFAWLK